eukprot:1587215-Prymnesium_polylepis.1
MPVHRVAFATSVDLTRLGLMPRLICDSCSALLATPDEWKEEYCLLIRLTKLLPAGFWLTAPAIPSANWLAR